MLTFQPHPLSLNTPALQCSFLSPLSSLTALLFPLSKLDTKCITFTPVFLLHLPPQSPNLDELNYLPFPIFPCQWIAHCCLYTFRVSHCPGPWDPLYPLKKQFSSQIPLSSSIGARLFLLSLGYPTHFFYSLIS